MCSVLKLHSYSRGLGAQRRVFITRTKSTADEQSAEGTWKRGADESAGAAKARECQQLLADEQGGHCAYSVAELQEWLASGEPLPPEIERLHTVRCAVRCCSGRSKLSS